MLTVNELFSGIGSQRAALERLGIEHKVVGIAEIDKFAIKSYEAIWGETKNYGDISKVDKLDYADFWTYSFPCQDISVAGKQEGIKKGKTRSGLLYEVERLLEKSKECGELPKYLMLENVKNLVGKRFKSQFEEWITRLDELGYNTYWQVLNAKNYGIPQNRERVFGVSIRKDIDTGYVFPEPFELKTRLKDILEDEVDEKFYLDNAKTRNLIRQLDYKPTKEIKLNQLGNFEKLANPSKKFNDPQTGRVLDAEGIYQALDTMQGGNRQPKILQVGNVNPSGKGMNGNVFSEDGLAPTLTTNKGEGNKICHKTSNKKGYIECNVPGIADLSFLDSKTRRGRVQENGEIYPTLMAGQQDICYIEQRYVSNISDEYSFVKSKCQEMLDEKGDLPNMFNPYNKAEITNIAPTQTTSCDRSCSSATVLIKQPQYRIRKLIPLECWRLMGFTDEQFQKAKEVNSNFQLCKQAGNSIVVDALYYLFKNLFIDSPTEKTESESELQGQMSIMDYL